MPTGSALKSERPCWGAGGVGGGKGHGMVYLVDTIGILGSGQSPRFTVSESGKREHSTLAGEALSNKDQTHTSHRRTQNLL